MAGSLAACAQGSSGKATKGNTASADLFQPGPGKLVLSLQDLSCGSCGNTVVDAVTKAVGVANAVFDKDLAEVGVAYDEARATPETILTAGQASGYTMVIGAGQGTYAPTVEHPKAYDTKVISRGEEVELATHLVAGKVTVVDFYADWCGPCRRVAIVMNAVMSERDDVALRKIDIVDWDTPVSKQHMAGVASLPYTIIYDPQGREVRRITGLDIPGLHAAIDEASGGGPE